MEADDVDSCRRQVGRFELLALLDAVGVFPLPVDEAFGTADAGDWSEALRLDPAAMRVDGSWRLAFRSYAIQRPDGGVTVIDLGVGDHGSPAASWAPAPGDLPAKVEQSGLDRTAVDTVVLTHLHSDHVGWVLDPGGSPFFPSARHLVQRRELEHLRSSQGTSVWQHAVQPLLDHHLLDAIDGHAVLASAAEGDDRIELVPTPGHTPGHQSVEVTSQGFKAVVTGDVFVHAVQVANPRVTYRHEWSSEQAVVTRQHMLSRAQETSATLANPHLMTPYLRV